MLRSFKYRLFTNANQERELARTLETHRRLYNAVLSGKQLCWDTAQVDWSSTEQSTWFKIQRRTNCFYANLNFGSAQQTLRRLDTAYKRFFDNLKNKRKAGPPRFKSIDRFNSFSFALTGKGGGCKIVNGKLRLQNIGTIRVRWHRELPEGGTLKQATIKRYAGKWYVFFVVELPNTDTKSVPTDSVGIDLGINAFVATSDGEFLGDSKTLRSNLKELRRKQRALSRCERGSGVRLRRKLLVQKLHAKVANTRRDVHHKVAKHLTDRFGLIAVESLNISGMIKNRRLSRAIADAAWGQFIGILQSKAESAWVQVVTVDARNTSQACSACGEIVRKSLSVRIHRCDCGLVLDRDVNAARNILTRGRAVPRIAKLDIVLV